MIKSLCTVLTSLALTCSFAVAAKTDKKAMAPEALLKETSKTYRNSKLVKITVDKKVTSELLGKSTNYQGMIYLSQGKFRWENETPDKTLLVYNGTTIWNVQFPPEELGGGPQVGIAKVDKNTKSQILISTLIGKDPIDKNFKVLSEKEVDGLKVIELQPLSTDLRVKSLTLSIDPKKKEIKQISYKDDVDNLTVIEMKKTDFQKKENKELFNYKVPKDATVTNL